MTTSTLTTTLTATTAATTAATTTTTTYKMRRKKSEVAVDEWHISATQQRSEVVHALAVALSSTRTVRQSSSVAC